MKQHRIGIIGFGKMSEALIAGAIKQKTIVPKQIFVLRHHEERDRQMKKKYHLQLSDSLKELCEQTDTLLLGVKPKQMRSVLLHLKPFLKHQTLWSMAAGLKVAFYQKYLGKNIALIRLMPNTPVQLGCGTIGILTTTLVKKSAKKFCLAFMESVGSVYEFQKEAQMNALIPLSGSGPAFVYQYAIATIEAGKHLGFSHQISQEIALNTLLGAAQMLSQTQKDPSELIREVASPNGTTCAGLAVLEKNGFNALVRMCFEATAKRAEEINQEMESS